MEEYYSWGGRSNPDFYYKVNVLGVSVEMLDWCKQYQSGNPGRFYCHWVGRNNTDEYVEFQFETEEPAIMFALKFGAA